MTKVLAVASGGGHWEQLMLLRIALDQFDTRYATTEKGFAEQHGLEKAHILPDCNQNRPFRSLQCLIVALLLIIKLRPDVVVSTGAAPGFFCIFAGKLIGSRTLWIDSIANAEQLSMCGRLATRIADKCLTQWEHLASDPSPDFAGALL
ncbi:MAG: glucuronosyltransferase [Erythrobacter sp.]